MPEGLNPNVTGYLVYSDSNANPSPNDVATFDPFDDFLLVPEDGEVLLENPDYSFKLDVMMDNLGDGAN